MSTLKIFSFYLLIIMVGFNAAGQPDIRSKIDNMTREEIMELSQDDLLEMSMDDLVYLSQKMGISIDELLNMKTNVASKATLTPRETPGIVSFITEEEIRYSGARDLIDVLRLVPGFDFGYDVGGVIGVGLRGNWVHEGKLLMLIDGQAMNELSYYNIPFGNHFPVDQIKRIEIIRGPGSAIYGGNAELGVINIITKSGKDLKGLEVAGTYGQMQESMGRTNLNINTGFKAKNWDINAKGFFGNANQSDQIYNEYIDKSGGDVDFSEGNSGLKTVHLNVGATNDKLSFRMIYDDYKAEYIFYDFDTMINFSTVNQFRSLLGEVKYNFQVNDKLSITPKLNYRYNRPFYEDDYWRNYEIVRYSGAVLLNYQAGKRTNIDAGFEYLADKGKCLGNEGYFYSTEESTLDLSTLALYGEGTYKMNKLNLIAGFRAEHSNSYGWASAPRVGLTGVFNKFHFKALVSGAFRTPAVGNIDGASRIEPEKSFVSELEFGYRINDNMFITANFFDIEIKKSIVYFDTGANWVPIIDWGYINADNAGSDGFEFEFKAKYAKMGATVNYSYYTQAWRTLPSAYKVPGHENAALGLSQHRFGLYGYYLPFSKISIGPSFILIGRKDGYASVDEEGNPAIGKFGPYPLVNLALTYTPIKGLDIQATVNDILNEKPPYVHPYEGWYSAYTGRSREVLIKLVLSTDLLK